LNEFVASYFAYAFVSERKPELKAVEDLCGRPTSVRPKNTTLTDFERLYLSVDDVGWYHGMFSLRIKEAYPKMGIQFLKELKLQFPAAAAQTAGASPNGEMKAMPPEEALDKVESISPGFQVWARGFVE
jgi:hypothetical protein